MSQLNVLILAAGEGTRMRSALPKVLHRAAGKPLLAHVLDAAAPLKAAAGVVIGRGADQVKAAMGTRGLSFFLQKERRGSGHAVMSARSWLTRRGGDVMVLCGDAPLIRPETLKALAGLHKKEKNAATLLTARVEKPFGYGRIVRDPGGRVTAIVEEKDATAEQRAIDEVNSGTYVFRVPDLLKALAKVRPTNAKGEYYITDVIGLLVGEGKPVGALCLDGDEEGLGVNTRVELAQAERILRRRTADRLMQEGVTLINPDATYIDADVEVGADTVIWPETYLLSGTRVGANCCVGPWAWLKACRVADGAKLTAVVAEDSELAPDSAAGPFARLRGGAKVGRGAKVGNFVELKNAALGPGVKAGHLAYLGDAEVGEDANIGAGTITCNYDGYRKSRTVIGKGAFIGSNANLVAPVRVGAGAVVGAGSTITQDVPADALALERAQQISKPGWAARRRAQERKTSHG